MSTYEEDQLSQTNQTATAEKRALSDRVSHLSIPALTWELLAWVMLLTTALVTRFWNLGARVMSHDESEHAYFSWILSKGGGYQHNPMMHGPLLFEVTAVFQAIFKASDFTTRIAPALIGITIVIVVPMLLRPWLGRLGALMASLFMLVSPYVLYYSRYDRHDIYEIVCVLFASFAILSYLRAREKEAVDQAAVEQGQASSDEEPPVPQPALLLQNAPSEHWLLALAGIEALMFSAMETAFIYLAIMASFLVIRLVARNGLQWKRLQRAPEFDLIVILATLGAFFSAPIALLVLNPIWTRITGQPFVPVETLSSFGIEWSKGPYGLRIWGLMIVFWWAAAVVGIFWNWRRWWKPAVLFLFVTVFCFTTFFSNWAGIGTGFVGSLGYWLSQQGVARGSQPWYYYFIVFPLYEYTPILLGVAAMVYYAIRRSRLSPAVRMFIPYVTWWAVLIFVALSIAGEKMPWLSTHITVPFILLSGWFVGHLLQPAPVEENQTAAAPRWRTLAIALPVAVLVALTARTAYMANYINYDSVIEFVDYAHGAPGVKWMVSDAQKIAALTGQGSSMPVAFDSDNSWPLTWYLRDRSGFYGDQPNRATLLQTPVVIAGQQNWQKVENFLGPDYNRYDVIRIWWPMEDYKDLTWDRIRGAITNPEMRQAVWNILWNRDYSLYAKLTKEKNLDAPKVWPLQDRMRVYIRKDLAAKIPDLALKSSQIADIAIKPDPYASNKIEAAPLKVIQPEGLNLPRNLTFAPDGSIYVADSGNSRIVHLDGQGKVLGTFGSRTPDKQVPAAPGTFNEPWGAAVDAQGNVYVTDTWNHRIQKFDSTGKFLLQFGVAGLSSDGPDRFWGPRGIAVGPNGDLYITDTGNRRVAVFDPQGKFLFDFSKDGQAQLNEPVGIAINKQGQVFVADTWNQRVAVFDSQGKFITSWPVEAWNSTSVDEKPFLALDQQGRVYLTDPEGYRVMVFSSTGQILAVFGQYDTSENGFNLPTGLAASPNGEIWVADAGNNRIEAYPALKK